MEFLGLFGFYALALSWLWTAGPLIPHFFPPAPAARPLLLRAALCVLSGAAVFAMAGRRPRWLLEGALFGLVVSVLGYCAGRWLVIAHAWTMLGWFSGTLLRSTMPLLLAAALASVCVARHHEDFGPVRGTFVALLLIFWAGGARLALWRLRAAHAFGPGSLAEAAGVPTGEEAPLVRQVLLRPSTTTAAGYEAVTRRAGEGFVDVEGENLIRLYAYLKRTDYQGVFARDAVADLREGWFLWWDGDRALESAMLARPGAVAPAYLPALALLRAGPLTIERFQKLRALNELGRERKEGFEDVNRSQLIFEAFSAAYARFGDEEGAREWLYKVDNLWPIYEKKVEASPVESFHDGVISGTLETGDHRPTSVLVGLFWVGTSTAATIRLSTPTLSMSDFPDANGRFAFRDLGAGAYYLGLEGAVPELSAPVTGSPGYVAVDASTPVVHLDPIRVGFQPADFK